VRILQVVSYYAPAWGYGGPPRVMFELARKHVLHGHSVTVYTSDAFDAERRVPEREADLEGIHVRYFRNVSNRAAWRHKKFFPRGLASALRKHGGEFDVMHLSDSRGWVPMQGYRGSRATGLPLALSAFGSLGGSPGVRGMVKDVYDSIWVRPMVRDAAALLAQTDHEAQVYRDFGGSTAIAQVPLGFDPADFGDLPAPGAFRRARGFADDDKIALFIGRLHATKGLDFLLRCVAALHRDDPTWRLVIVGVDNGMLETVQSLARDLNIASRLTFTGPLFGRDRFEIMVDADVFVITPNIFEETSQASIEAAATGLPVVVTEQADIPFLEAAGGGFVVPRTESAVITALRSIVTSREHARSTGVRARQLMFERFTWDAVARQLEGIFESIRPART